MRSYSKIREWNEIKLFQLDRIYVHNSWECMFKELFQNIDRKKKIEDRFSLINQLQQRSGIFSSLYILVSIVAKVFLIA